MNNDWIKWNGDTTGYIGGMPVVAGERVDVIFRNGMARTSTVDDFNWAYRPDSTDEADIVSYRISDTQTEVDLAKPCLCFPGQCRGQVVDGKQPNGDRCKQEYAKSDEAWFDWDTSTLPTHPGMTTGNFTLEWQFHGAFGTANGEAHDPAWHLAAGPHAVKRYRWTDPRVMLLNPYTGQKRNAVDIMQDPEGRLVQMASDVQLMSTKLRANSPSLDSVATGFKELGDALRSFDRGEPMPPAELTQIVTDPAQIEAAFERDQEAADNTRFALPETDPALLTRGDEDLMLRLPGDVFDVLEKTAQTRGQKFDDLVAEILRRDIEASFKENITEVRVSGIADLREIDLSNMQLEPGQFVQMSLGDPDDLPTIDGQFNDFMEGMGAGEDHDDMRKALLSLGLAEGTVTKMMTTLAHSEAKRQRIEATAAIGTLARMGYTYTQGGVFWTKPNNEFHMLRGRCTISGHREDVEELSRIIGDPDEASKTLGDSITDDDALHVVRNPWGWSKDSVRRARLLLADRFEKVKRQRDEIQKLRDTTAVTIKPTAEWEDLVRRDQAAIGTLMALGYEWKGGTEWAPPIGMALPFKAHELLDQARNHMKARAATYDKPKGERSMGATVEAFNAITGRDLRESEGWLLMTLLKLVRSETRDEPHRDSVEDLIAYSGLYGEARLGGV